MPTKDNNTVKRILDLKKPPQLSAEQKARLDAVAAMPDERIDYSDTPALSDAVWITVETNLPHTKKQITLRIDADVLDFFKCTGKRYQSRMNAVLRSYVGAQKTHAKR